MTLVRFIKDYKQETQFEFEKGDEWECTSNMAEHLVREKVAQVVEPKVASKAKPKRVSI